MRLTPTWRHLDRASGRARPRPARARASWSSAPPARPRSSGARRSRTSRSAGASSTTGSTPTARTPSSASACRSAGGTCSTSRAARATHRRRVVPGRRRELSPEVNFHSLKNRYLLRVYHQTAANLLRDAALHAVPRRAGAGLGAAARARLAARLRLAVAQSAARCSTAAASIQGRKTRSIESWFLRDEVPVTAPALATRAAAARAEPAVSRFASRRERDVSAAPRGRFAWRSSAAAASPPATAATRR